MTGQNEFGYCSKNCPHLSEHQCYTLLQQEPCQNNHWLVASEFADKSSAECKIRKCEEGEIYFNGECHKNDSNSLCGESQVLLLNPFGEGTILFTYIILTNLERVVSIESWDSPQCSTNVIGATHVGISEKGLVIESIFLHQSQ